MSAREALSRKQQQVDASTSLDEQIAIQSDSLSKLYDSMTALESKISEARSMKDQYIARARTAKTATKVNDMLSSVSGTTSMDAFERMKEKVEMLETQAGFGAVAVWRRYRGHGVALQGAGGRVVGG